MVSRKKMQTSAEKLCGGQSAPFRRFCEASMSMRFDEEPKYAALIALFEPLLGCSSVARPIAIAQEAIRVRIITLTGLTCYCCSGRALGYNACI